MLDQDDTPASLRNITACSGRRWLLRKIDRQVWKRWQLQPTGTTTKDLVCSQASLVLYYATAECKG